MVRLSLSLFLLLRLMILLWRGIFSVFSHAGTALFLLSCTPTFPSFDTFLRHLCLSNHRRQMNHIWSEAELDAMLASKVKKKKLFIKTARFLFIFGMQMFTLHRPHGGIVGVVGAQLI